jgi:hypothetical protein
MGMCLYLSLSVSLCLSLCFSLWLSLSGYLSTLSLFSSRAKRQSKVSAADDDHGNHCDDEETVS